MIELAPRITIIKGKMSEVLANRSIPHPPNPKRDSKRKAPDTPVERPTVVKIKIPSIAMVNKSAQQSTLSKKRKGQDQTDTRMGDPVEEEEPPVPFGGIITGRDADTSKTQAGPSDIQLFEETRKVAEVSRSVRSACRDLIIVARRSALEVTMKIETERPRLLARATRAVYMGCHHRCQKPLKHKAVLAHSEIV